MLNLDEIVPRMSVAGIETIQCECGWESVYVVPEEGLRMAGDIMNHLRWYHRLEFPMFTVTNH